MWQVGFAVGSAKGNPRLRRISFIYATDQTVQKAVWSVFSNIKKDTKTLGGIEKTGGCVGVFILMRLGLAGGFDSFVKPVGSAGGFKGAAGLWQLSQDIWVHPGCGYRLFPYLAVFRHFPQTARCGISRLSAADDAVNTLRWRP